MDISQFSTKATAENTFKVILKNPETGIDLEHEGKPMFAVVQGKDSKAFKAAASRLINADNSGRKKDKIDIEAEEKKSANLLAAVTNELTFFAGGKWVKIDNSEDQAQYEMRDALLEYVWIKEQLDIEIGDRANFMQKPSKA